MKSIHEVIREKELQIASLQREVVLLRAAAKIVGAEQRETAPHARSNHMSQPQMIRAVLLEKTRPLHVDQIAEAIGKRFKVRLKRTDITPIIYRAIRAKKLFRKEGTNTFGLVEWQAKRGSRGKN
jgi:hypothetical protein